MGTSYEGDIPAGAGLAVPIQKRVALVVGNGAYRSTAPLKNPRNDARMVADKLQDLGFEIVGGREHGTDLNYASMSGLIRDFSRKIQHGVDAALFYFAGHGIQVESRNYLVPIDAELQMECAVSDELIELHHVLRSMERNARSSLVLLDACRNNPLAQNLARRMGSSTRSMQVGTGLAEQDILSGTLIAYATNPGHIAYDGDGENGFFTRALLDNIDDATYEIEALLKAVRMQVVAATRDKPNGPQIPWVHSSLMEHFYFHPIEERAPNPTPEPWPEPRPEPTPTPNKTADRAGGRTAAKPGQRSKWAAAAVAAIAVPAALLFGLTSADDRQSIWTSLQATLATVPEPSRNEPAESKSRGGNATIKTAVEAELETAVGPDADAQDNIPEQVPESKAMVAKLKGKPSTHNAAESLPRELLSDKRHETAEPDFSRCSGLEINVVENRRKTACVRPGNPRASGFQECLNGRCAPRMLVVPAGSYLRGSDDGPTEERPVRRVTIARPFAIGKFEVTFDDWQQCVDDRVCKPLAAAATGSMDRPVSHVSWRDITEDYLPWLNDKLGLRDATAYRLPTEAEWEYAARATMPTRYVTGNSIIPDQARFARGRSGRTAEVDSSSYRSNAWGLRHVHGNVSEWVQDCFANGYGQAPSDGTAYETENCTRRVHRGGSLTSTADEIRFSARDMALDDQFSRAVGFRVARSL
ncbi:MAG: SUMF1/EgtB/PvdO family nonheme iron enzyme [Filomicrobium sp.]